MPTMQQVPSSSIDLYADDVVLEPYDVYCELREAGPLVYLEPNEVWAVTRYAGARSVLRDWEHFSSHRGLALNEPVNDQMVGTVLASDPPDHTALRRVLSSRLSPAAVRDLGQQIDEQAEKVLAPLVAKGEFDAAKDLAAVFPITVIADLIGLPEEGRDRLLLWAEASFDSMGPENDRTHQAMPPVGEMWRYMGEVATRDNLTPGGWGHALYEAADRGEIEVGSCIPLLGAYLAAGMDTTVNSIGSGMMLFAQHPDQWQALRADPELIRGACNEILRLESPVQKFSRRVAETQTLEGVELPAGSRTLVLFASANRDEDKWDRPTEFDIGRNPVDHLGFGFGVHRCAGSALAMLEMESVFRSLARRVERIEITGEPERKINNCVRGLHELPVSVSQAAQVDATAP
ncbi:MAG TPA: cytochrome P450 [Solirubrobacterales bacterium]|nr:cytochrome P450 [Solirubrobacterales bacterium]